MGSPGVRTHTHTLTNRKSFQKSFPLFVIPFCWKNMIYEIFRLIFLLSSVAFLISDRILVFGMRLQKGKRKQRPSRTFSYVDIWICYVWLSIFLLEFCIIYHPEEPKPEPKSILGTNIHQKSLAFHRHLSSQLISIAFPHQVNVFLGKMDYTICLFQSTIELLDTGHQDNLGDDPMHQHTTHTQHGRWGWKFIPVSWYKANIQPSTNIAFIEKNHLFSRPHTRHKLIQC